MSTLSQTARSLGSSDCMITSVRESPWMDVVQSFSWAEVVRSRCMREEQQKEVSGLGSLTPKAKAEALFLGNRVSALNHLLATASTQQKGLGGGLAREPAGKTMRYGRSLRRLLS